MRCDRTLLPLLGLTVFLLGGCAQKVAITALKPAPIDRAASVQSLAVLPFERDRVGLGQKLSAEIAAYALDPGKSYFQVVERSYLESILDEQRFQHSGLVADSQTVEIGRLAGAQALIGGGVRNADHSDSHYRTERRKCVKREDRKCVRYRTYSVSCTQRVVNLSADIRMIDVAAGDVMASRSYDESITWRHCRDERGGLPGVRRGHAALSERISKAFIQEITPRYVQFEVVVIDDLDVKLPSPHEERFEGAIKFIEAGRLDRGETLLTDLHSATKKQSYAVAYNLGVIHEATGRLVRARKLYHLADGLTLEPIEPIGEALVRIDRLIDERDRARSQMADRQ
jgi:hypothetical protein